MQESDLHELLLRLAPVNRTAMLQVQARLDRQTKPRGSLGRLEEIARQFVAITGQETIRRKRIIVFAGDHGVAEEGTSAFPKAVTQEMVRNFIAGGAAINALAKQAEAEVQVVDVGVDADLHDVQHLHHCKVARGTANFSRMPAMSRAQVLTCFSIGLRFAREARLDGVDLLGAGEMGIGNTTSASALAAVFTGLPVKEVTFRGTGIDDHRLAWKRAVIQQAIELHRPNARDPLDVLAKVGGFEIAAIAGLVLGGGLEGIPVVVDGWISTVGALVVSELSPLIRDYLFAAHQSVEIGHEHVLKRMGLSPLLCLGMRLGEGTGAALAMMLVEAALRGLREIRTFEEAGVSPELSP